MSAKFTLITGASEGIGKELAIKAAKSRRDVILSARSKDKLDLLAKELSEQHLIETVVIPADLSKPGEAARLWEEASKGREIENLINNAGIGRNGPFAEEGWDLERKMLEINLISLTELMKLAVPHMVENGKGRILNVASVAGFIPGPGMAVYHATKSYVLSLTEAVAEELKATGVTVTALCPGATQTEFFNAADMGNVRLIKSGMLSSAKDVAEDGWGAMIVGKRVTVPGLMNKFFAILPRLLPRSLGPKITRQMLARSN